MKVAAPLLLVLLSLLSVGQAVYHYPQLPALVASHFNATGRVDGWMPPARFLQIQVTLSLALPVFFGLLAWMVAWLPRALLRQPQREAWLAQDRFVELRRRLAHLVLIIGCGVLAFLLYLQERVFQANVDGTHRLTPSAGTMRTIALVLIIGPAVIPLLSFWRRARSSKPRP